MALLKLEKPLRWTGYVRPVCLPSSQPITKLNPKDVIIACYGAYHLIFDSNSFPLTPSRLKVATVPYINPVVCLNGGINLSTRFCLPASWRDDDLNIQIRATCRGDSGGPVLHDRGRDRWELLGITSWSTGADSCSEGPSTYVTVSYYRELIINTISQSSELH